MPRFTNRNDNNIKPDDTKNHQLPVEVPAKYFLIQNSGSTKTGKTPTLRLGNHHQQQQQQQIVNLPSNILQVQLVSSTALSASILNNTNAAAKSSHQHPLLLPKASAKQNSTIDTVKERLKAVLSKNTADVQKTPQSTFKSIAKHMDKNPGKLNALRRTTEKQCVVQPKSNKISSAERKNAAAVRYR